MSGVAFSVLFLFCLFISLIMPAYVCLWASKKLYLSIATIKPVTVLTFKRRRFSPFAVFVGDVEFFEEKKNRKKPFAVENPKISTRFIWSTGTVFNTKKARKVLFDKDIPCTLDFYVFKWPFSSRYRGTPVRSFEQLYRNNSTLSIIILVFVFLFCVSFPIGLVVTSLSKFGFTPVETLELTGRLGKTGLMSKGNLENRVTYEMTLSYLNELCPPSAVRPLCQKRDRLIKRLAEPPKDPQFNE